MTPGKTELVLSGGDVERFCCEVVVTIYQEID
jgi:hypothetical protein